MIHATGIMDHGPRFRKIALAIGLCGKMTATEESDEFLSRVSVILDRLGKFPHAALDANVGIKKQSTRMIKCACSHPDCGMVYRTSQKWVNESLGQMTCPICTSDVTIG